MVDLLLKRILFTFSLNVLCRVMNSLYKPSDSDCIPVVAADETLRAWWSLVRRQWEQLHPWKWVSGCGIPKELA